MRNDIGLGAAMVLLWNDGKIGWLDYYYSNIVVYLTIS